jgi:hypothetical protein
MQKKASVYIDSKKHYTDAKKGLRLHRFKKHYTDAKKGLRLHRCRKKASVYIDKKKHRLHKCRKKVSFTQM